MLGACATGIFAQRAINPVPAMAANAVPVNSADLSMPVVPNIIGLTTSMYDIVRNVIIPANTSLFTVVLRVLSWKNVSNVFGFTILGDLLKLIISVALFSLSINENRKLYF